MLKVERGCPASYLKVQSRARQRASLDRHRMHNPKVEGAGAEERKK
jgi:hypothetical protein